MPPARRVRGGDLSALDYRSSGVDITAADAAKDRIRKHVESTFTPETRGAFGAFGGLSALPAGLSSPLLVASADGVGSKIRVAITAGRHDTIGRDLVNHCVNDILAQGARPLFFLDYVAFGRLDGDVLEQIVGGVAAACRENGCALIGGETAEMPDLYDATDYDLAGFIVGTVDESRALGARNVREGDVLLGLPSSGLHTNGYTLARRIVDERMRGDYERAFPGDSASIADVLLSVHRSYLNDVARVIADVSALAHITGGGLPGNLNRVLPAHLDAVVDTDTWNVPRVFEVLAREGEVPRDEMFRTFNMGVGMVAVVTPDRAERVLQVLRTGGCEAWKLGFVRAGTGRVHIA